MQVDAATVRLFSDVAATKEVGKSSASKLAVTGTDVTFADVLAWAAKAEIDQVSGTFYGAKVASLAEIEVIASDKAP